MDANPTRQATIDAWMQVAKALVMARIERAKLRMAFPAVEDTGEAEHPFGGIQLRVNPYMPEGLIGFVDRHDHLLGVVDIRGDHEAR